MARNFRLSNCQEGDVAGKASGHKSPVKVVIKYFFSFLTNRFLLSSFLFLLTKNNKAIDAIDGKRCFASCFLNACIENRSIQI